MPTFKIELDQATYETLVAVAIREWRPTQWQAEILLRKAILRESSDEESQQRECPAGPEHPQGIGIGAC